MRLSQRGIENIRHGLKRSWIDGAHRLRQQSSDIDADTLRYRALHDRRGSFYAKITKEVAGKTIDFLILWSTNGRTDQVDIFENGHLLKTIRPAIALKIIDELVA